MCVPHFKLFSVHRFKAKPKMDVHKRENLEIAFRFMQDVEKIPMVNIGKYLVLQNFNG